MYVCVCMCASDRMEEIKDIKNINSQGPYSLVEKRKRTNFYQYGCVVTQTYTGGLLKFDKLNNKSESSFERIFN